MSASSPLPDNHPAMIAWRGYQKTAAFQNNVTWASDKPHTVWALWAVFWMGWMCAKADKGTPVPLIDLEE